MDRKLKIIIVVAMVIIVSVAAYLLIRKPTATTPSTPTPQAPQAQFTIPPENAEKMTVPTSKGNFDTNNIYKNPVEKLSDNGVAFKDSADYYMAFYPQDEAFIITLKNPDINAVRTQAESDFLQTLGIPKDAACQMNVLMYVPAEISEKNAGQNFGLSFCPDGKPFQ